MVKLLPELVRRGLCVSTIKHAHHDFDVDTPGKDSYEHRAAGATEVMVSSAKRWALMHEHRGGPEADLNDLLARMSPVDLVLVEGFKREKHSKIEVVRGAAAKPILAPNDPYVVAIASDQNLTGIGLPLLDLGNVGAVADFIVEHCGLAVQSAKCSREA